MRCAESACNPLPGIDVRYIKTVAPYIYGAAPAIRCISLPDLVGAVCPGMGVWRVFVDCITPGIIPPRLPVDAAHRLAVYRPSGHIRGHSLRAVKWSPPSCFLYRLQHVQIDGRLPPLWFVVPRLFLVTPHNFRGISCRIRLYTIWSSFPPPPGLFLKYHWPGWSCLPAPLAWHCSSGMS